MKLSRQEKDSLRESFRNMDFHTKADYIFTYYKLPILLMLIAFLILSSSLYHHITRKETVVYLGLVNVSVGTDLENTLTQGFLKTTGANLKKNQVNIYSGLYLSMDPAAEDHEYAYASRMKVMAAVNARQLDIVLMNQEAYNIFSQSGYLLDLSDCMKEYASYLTENDVVLEDNAIEFQLNEADEHRVVTERAVNGIDISRFPLFQNAGFTAPVYAGILANSPRLSASTEYLHYLIQDS